jgi:hypothetical protein
MGTSDEKIVPTRSRVSRLARHIAFGAVFIVLAIGGLAVTAALASPSGGTSGNDQYACNSGRGNGSDGSDVQLIDPHAGGTGTGISPTVDCDPGNSGNVNSGGD